MRDSPPPLPNGHEKEYVIQPDIVNLATVESKSIDWLWHPYIARGMISILNGDPGAGKTFINLAIAAGLSIGQLPDGTATEVTTTLYLTSENPIEQVICPRFERLGGDPRYFNVMRGGRYSDNGEKYSMTLRDVELLEQGIARTGAGFIVIDPIQSYLGANVDMHRANETRPILDRLADLVTTTNAAMTLSRHLNKTVGGKAIYRGLGSIDITAVARTELLAGSSPDHPEEKALIHIKTNIGPFGKSLGYSIQPVGSGDDCCFSWTSQTSITEEDILAAPSTIDANKLDCAEAWLREFLQYRSRPQKEVEDAAKKTGFSWRTIRRAEENLQILHKKFGTANAWFWSLPSGQDDHKVS
jgi:hypothetical protein